MNTINVKLFRSEGEEENISTAGNYEFSRKKIDQELSYEIMVVTIRCRDISIGS